MSDYLMRDKKTKEVLCSDPMWGCAFSSKLTDKRGVPFKKVLTFNSPKAVRAAALDIEGTDTGPNHAADVEAVTFETAFGKSRDLFLPLFHQPA